MVCGTSGASIGDGCHVDPVWKIVDAIAVPLPGMFSSFCRKRSRIWVRVRQTRNRQDVQKVAIRDEHLFALRQALELYGQEYVDQGEQYYEQQYRVRVQRNLARRAHEFGLKLVPINGLGADANRGGGGG